MRTPLIRRMAGLLGIMVLSFLVFPLTASAATARNVENGDEAWFVQHKEPLTNFPDGDPTCETDAGCNLAGNVQRRPENEHPEGVLVVAANAGQPDAQTFINFDAEKLPLGALVTGGTVTLPTTTDPESRQTPNAAQAKMQACLVKGFIPGGADGGSYNDRPEIDDKTCTDVKLAKEDPLEFTVDLARFGKVWASEAQFMNGITLRVHPSVPSPDPRQTWRVVFNSNRRANQKPNPEFKYPRITWNLQYKVEKFGAFPTFDDPVPAAGGGGGDFSGGGGDLSGGGGDFGGGGGDFGGGDAAAGSGGFASDDAGAIQAPPVDSGAPAVGPPEAAGDQVPQQQAAPQMVPAGAIGPSPAVWAVPLIALAMAAMLTWSLIQPVQLAGAREGAVSKLMRTRRLSSAEPT